MIIYIFCSYIYHILLQRLERNEMFDFIPIWSDRTVLMMYPKPQDFDIGLFVRPLRQERQVTESYASDTLPIYNVT